MRVGYCEAAVAQTRLRLRKTITATGSDVKFEELTGETQAEAKGKGRNEKGGDDSSSRER